MNLEKNRYVDIIFSIFAFSFLIWLLVDYDSLVYSDHMPTGIAAKKMRTLLLLLDKAIGKFWSIFILFLLALPFFYRSVLKFREKKVQIEQEKLLSVGDWFKVDNNKVNIKKITSTKDGYSGYGEVEMGIINKVKETVRFSNIKINENRKVISGEVEVLNEGEHT
ncbi:hypothetical protein L21SP5_00227 [Salinivirga cyanobacteriivorans]|uniref:Uncharacterized protein n=1 Tax=Salinivirga cyanobacteriivorans TaxID=1307839 RepID=A0A0S2HV19_9BACT|nr:hypothetical protein [Salinivirga cyanobacteriivorans]ALO13907.1 hypothetical protein L21SP5_00227 [Salinivirga cyanobacteriivorans]